MGYALWLVPSSTEFTALSALMKFRPKSYTQDSRSRSYPSFDPHTTLVTFDVLPSSFNLDAIPFDGLAPPVVHFDSVKRGNSYLGALSIVISQSEMLMRLRDVVTAHLDTQNIRWKSRSFPHMSLFYVDEPDERNRLYDELIRGRLIHVDKRVTLTANSDDPSMQVKTFTGTEIWLVDCTRSVKRWDVMKKRSLVPPAPPQPQEIVPQKLTVVVPTALHNSTHSTHRKESPRLAHSDVSSKPHRLAPSSSPPPPT